MKLMKRTVSIVLIAVMVLVMAGCSSEKDKLLGRWEGEMDMTQRFKDQMGAEDLESLEAYVTLENIVFTIYMDFQEDGTYSMGIDEQSFQTAMEGLVNDMVAGITAYFEDMIAQTPELEGATVDDLLALSGTSIDAMVEELWKELENEDFTSKLSQKGNWDAKKGQLFATEDVNDSVSEDTYYEYTLEDGVLTLTKFVSSDSEDAEEENEILPLSFTKAA